MPHPLNNYLLLTVKENIIKLDGFVKSPLLVMPDLIRHPEAVEFTGLWLSPE